jgi:2'-5' RNA ligase
MRGIRTFISLPLPSGLAKYCNLLISELKGRGVEARWAIPEELHITLTFMGELKTMEVVSACRSATKIAAKTESFILGISGLERGERETRAFQKELSDLLISERLYRTDDKPFHPHITLGRLNESIDLDAEGLLDDFRHHKSPVGRIETCLVMESIPGTDPRYATMATCPLAKAV